MHAGDTVFQGRMLRRRREIQHKITIYPCTVEDNEFCVFMGEHFVKKMSYRPPGKTRTARMNKIKR